MEWYIWIVCVYFGYSVVAGGLGMIKSEGNWDVVQSLLDIVTKSLGVLLAFQYGYKFLPVNENYVSILFYALISLSALMILLEIKYVFFKSEQDRKERMAEIGKEIADGIRDVVAGTEEDRLAVASSGVDNVVSEYETDLLGEKVGLAIMLVEVSVIVWLGYLAISVVS